MWPARAGSGALSPRDAPADSDDREPRDGDVDDERITMRWRDWPGGALRKWARRYRPSAVNPNREE